VRSSITVAVARGQIYQALRAGKPRRYVKVVGLSSSGVVKGISGAPVVSVREITRSGNRKDRKGDRPIRVQLTLSGDRWSMPTWYSLVEGR